MSERYKDKTTAHLSFKDTTVYAKFIRAYAEKREISFTAAARSLLQDHIDLLMDPPSYATQEYAQPKEQKETQEQEVTPKQEEGILDNLQHLKKNRKG